MMCCIRGGMIAEGRRGGLGRVVGGARGCVEGSALVLVSVLRDVGIRLWLCPRVGCRLAYKLWDYGTRSP